MGKLYPSLSKSNRSDIYELSLVPAENEWIYAEWGRNSSSFPQSNYLNSLGLV